MAVFQSAQELYEAIAGYFHKAKFDAEIGPKIAKSGLVIRFEYSDPDSVITVDCKRPEPEGAYFAIIEGDNDLNPDVLMTMKADIAHQFWLGKVNLLAALNRRQIVAKGPIPKILALLPAIKPAYEQYPQHLREIGRTDLAG